MYVLRSAFWLTAAFFVLKPGADLERSAADALAAGQRMVAEYPCEDLACHAGRAALAAALPAVPPPAAPVPLPPPRPDRLG